ncbi:MAG: short-chain dehydrogenase [Anaerolineae bacterium]|nr:short-chain dehydrogenase [Anaerolineae bacterium]
MDIRGKNVMVFGGYGLVGAAVCRDLMAERPARLVIGSLRRDEAESAVRAFRAEFPDSPTALIPTWGNVFTRREFKDLHPTELFADPVKRARHIADTFDPLNDAILHAANLYQLMTGQAEELGGQPAHIVIDCVNTATAIAYQNVYRRSDAMRAWLADPDGGPCADVAENLIGAQYLPQLVRHVQILYKAAKAAGTEAYVKVGTSGTGGMGLNIPFTHGEEKPSRMLLSKSAIAGAHSQLLFLLARTPDALTVVKEIKPAAAIAWKKIGYGPVADRGGPITLYDCPLDAAVPVEQAIAEGGRADFGQPLGRQLESVYIDTGENGVFSLDEFTAITTLGQMEFVTPQEIAAAVVQEIKGSNTGRDIVGALDGAVMGPTYRAGVPARQRPPPDAPAEQQHGVRSVAFEVLGPPRLSKLLFEAHLLERLFRTMDEALAEKPETMAHRALEEIGRNQHLRAHIVSIGLAILLPDGKCLLRGPVIKSTTPEGGWVDLTPENMALWQRRLSQIVADIDAAIRDEDTSSERRRAFPAERNWAADHSFDVGEIVGWLFIHEEEGVRGKA